MTTVEISMTLRALVEELADAVSNTAELVEKVKTQAEEEGLSAKDTRELIISALKKRQLSDRTITRMIPEELKSQKAKEWGKHGGTPSHQFPKETKGANMSPSEESPQTIEIKQTVPIQDADIGEELEEESETKQMVEQASETVQVLVDRSSVLATIYPLKTHSRVMLVLNKSDGKVVEWRGVSD